MKLKINDDTFIVTNNQILFPQYEQLKIDALELAENLRSIEVTEDTLKTNKKLIAGVRKATDKLKSELSGVRKQCLQPYDILKVQVDEIISIVTEAENVVRNQTKDFEEVERNIKQDKIIDMFNKHLNQYPLVKKYIGDESYFVKGVYLNKTYSINKVEESLVKDLNSTETDLNVMLNEPNAAELITEYKKVGSLAVAMQIVMSKNNDIELVNKKIDRQVFNIKVFNKKDYELLKNYMKEMDIEYK
ncbi:DUF1351 domain-containing protein [Gemella sp. GH3]|uniref:DUF1351 domain-containing protein n=1 Tax=unclassified Gemella TaxID=2624949 RepID=UPI0015D024F6|nr:MULTISPECIES: DUF1351 domain-containing protein [unclassified Gemella]MBF0714514.1 DUF1351 domain-containing protein [Gemella sp. GH3.1]NYS51466.1 DUF1351 domain-containing protein [Gemella sp. GH3]